jgi:hypothetical protein
MGSAAKINFRANESIIAMTNAQIPRALVTE